MYATDALKDDKEIVMIAVSQYGPALEFASPKFRKDPEVVLAAVENAGSALMFARELRKKKGFCLKALDSNAKCVTFIETELRQDPDIVQAAGDAAKAQRDVRCDRADLKKRAKKNTMPNFAP